MIFGFGNAQNAEISGTITDETGATFPTVLIFLDGTTIPVRSDMDGNYKLKNVGSGKHTILFRFPEFIAAIYKIFLCSTGVFLKLFGDKEVFRCLLSLIEVE
jgi:hypothetical protein